VGELIYGAGTKSDIDDRTLAHVKVAVGFKLRRQESFYLNWVIPASEGSGRVSLWMSPSIPVQFRYRDNTPPELSRAWLSALEMTALTDRGMVILPEEQAEAYIQDHPQTLTVS
jgi:hypothetical protein